MSAALKRRLNFETVPPIVSSSPTFSVRVPSSENVPAATIVGAALLGVAALVAIF